MKKKLPIILLLSSLSIAPLHAAFPVSEKKAESNIVESSIKTKPIANKVKPVEEELNIIPSDQLQIDPIESNISETNSIITTEESDYKDDQLIALILAAVLGTLGVHRFYLGYYWQGAVQLVTAGGLGVWWIIDVIRIATGDLKPKGRDYRKKL